MFAGGRHDFEPEVIWGWTIEESLRIKIKSILREITAMPAIISSPLFLFFLFIQVPSTASDLYVPKKKHSIATNVSLSDLCTHFPLEGPVGAVEEGEELGQEFADIRNGHEQ